MIVDQIMLHAQNLVEQKRLRNAELCSPSTSVTSANESDAYSTPPRAFDDDVEVPRFRYIRPGNAARRKLCLVDFVMPKAEAREHSSQRRETKSVESDAQLHIQVDEEESVSMDREGVSDIGESEVEGLAGRYILQTLNRTLMELYNTCEVDHNVDRCDYVLAILHEAIPSFEMLRGKILQEATSLHEGADRFSDSDFHMVTDTSRSVNINLVSKELDKIGANNQESKDDKMLGSCFRSFDCTRTTSGAEGPESDFFHKNSLKQEGTQQSDRVPSVQTWCDVVRRRDIQASSALAKVQGVLNVRTLQEKLLSPDRHRKNPEDMQKKQEEKQELAKKKREEFETLRQEKLREADQQRQEKLRQVREKRENEKISLEERLKRAHELYQAKLLERQQKAGKETTKVYEVKQEIAFIDQLSAENKILALQSRLELAEARRLQTLEAAAKVSERTMREASARQRRAAIEVAKIEKLQARQAQKFGSHAESTIDSLELEELRHLPIKEDFRDRLSVSRDEAARQRREKIETSRQRKVEQVAQEKEHRAEEHQRKLLEERMKVLAAKEARLRHQANRLERMTKAMQADAEEQKESLERRLQTVVERKQRYMSRIVAKAQGGKMTVNSLVASELSSTCGENSKAQGLESSEQTLERATKLQKKRAKKYRQRLIGLQNSWREKDPSMVHSSPKGPGNCSKISKINKLFSDLVKGVPEVDGIVKLSGQGGNTHPHKLFRDHEGLVRDLLDVVRLVKETSTDSRLSLSQVEREIACQLFRKSGCMIAVIRLISTEEYIHRTKVISAALKVLNVMCVDETNKLFLFTTGRLHHLVDLLDHILSEKPLDIDCESIHQLQQVMILISRCLVISKDEFTQVRDDTLGYLVSVRTLIKLESFIISVIKEVTSIEPVKNNLGQESKWHAISKWLAVLEMALDLVLAITKCCETQGEIKVAILDKSVLAELLSSFDECRLVGLVPLLSTLFLDVEICSPLDSSKERDMHGIAFPSSAAVTCGIKALRILNDIATMDLSLIQRLLGSVVICSEFSHVALRILEGDCAASSSSAEMLHELILLLGFMAFSICSETHSPFSGWRNGVKMLQQLCALPISYFISPMYREILLPTLVVATYNNSALLDAVREQLSAEYLASYLDLQLLCLHNNGRNPQVLSSDGLSSKWHVLPPRSLSSRFHLCNRFPAVRWGDALLWFRGCQ